MERTAATTALLTSLSLAMSFAYDWGFFSALGITFADAPTSVTDHLRSWLVWLPKFIPVAFLGLGLELLTRRIERGKTEAELIEGSANPTKTKRANERARRMITWGCGLVLVLWLAIGTIDFPWLAAAGCWMSFMVWVFKHPIVRERHAFGFRLLAFIGPPLILYFYSAGFRSATSAPTDSVAEVQVQADGVDEDTVTSEAEVLRSFENWFLVRDASDTIRWIRSDDVHGIRVKGETTPFPGVLCMFFRVCIDSTDD